MIGKLVCIKCNGSLGSYDKERNIFLECECIKNTRTRNKLLGCNLPLKFVELNFNEEFKEYIEIIDKFLNNQTQKDHILIQSAFFKKRNSFLALLFKKVLEENKNFTGYYIDFPNLLITINRSWKDEKLLKFLDEWKNADILCVSELNFLYQKKENMNGTVISDLLVNRQNNRKPTFLTSIRTKEELCKYYSLDEDLIIRANLDKVEENGRH